MKHNIINRVDLWSLGRMHESTKKEVAELTKSHKKRMVKTAETRRELQNIKNILTPYIRGGKKLYEKIIH